MQIDSHRINQIQLNYWCVRGAAQPIRHLLQYLKLPYTQKACQCPKRWFGSEIEQLKKKCVFTSLPFINDNGFIVSEIVAIAKYLCKKANRKDLLGKTIQDSVKIQQILIKFIRNRNKMFQLWNTNVSNASNNQNVLKQKVDSVYRQLMSENYLLPIIKIMEDKNDWLFGYLTIADFFVFQTCFYITGIFPDRITHKCIQDFKKRFEQMESIKNYYQSGRAMLKIFIIPHLNSIWKGDPKFI